MAKSNNKQKTTTPKSNKAFKVYAKRLAFIVMFSGSVAISAYFLILVSSPDLGQKVFGIFSAVSAVYYLIQAIK